MGDLERIKPGSKAIAAKADGNPDGKGANGFMLDWYLSEPRGVIAKPRRQVLAEMFTSMLVLSSAFKFRPAEGVPHYLYWINEEWSLSLIAPWEWTIERQKGFAGTCFLQHDMTWTIDPSDRLKDSNPVSDALGRFYDGFAEKLDTDMTLEDILPFYVGSLHYYPRLLSNALSRSVRSSLIISDERDVTCREWQGLLPSQKKILLGNTG